MATVVWNLSVLVAMVVMVLGVSSEGLEPLELEPHVPPPSDFDRLYKKIGPAALDLAANGTRDRVERNSLGGNFKYIYVGYKGREFARKPSDQAVFEVAATHRVSSAAHRKAVEIVKLMTKNMNWDIFYRLATNANVGVFSRSDTVAVYPEYSQYRDKPGCTGQCGGRCQGTCAGNGVKYSSVAGLGGKRATVLDDNLLCNGQDPYHSRYNVLIHEITHTIHQYGLASKTKREITSAYNTARSRRTWTMSSYAMKNELEYFGEAGTVFFNTNKNPTSSGGMNSCGKGYYKFCDSQQAARYYLWQKDPAIYGIVTYVFADNQPTKYVNLRTCM